MGLRPKIETVTSATDPALGDPLLSVLPWAAFLPEGDRNAFVQEVSETLHACASTGRYTALATLLEDWQGTAEIWADPDLAGSLSGPIHKHEG